MLKIYPQMSAYNSFSFKKNNNINKSNLYSETAMKDYSTDTISFQGSGASHKNQYGINKIANIINTVKKMAAVLHANPDSDTAGSAMGLVKMIKKATGKDVDIIILNPLPEKLQYIDPKNEIKVINKAPGMHANAEEIHNKYGDYDAVFCMDIAEKKLMDKEIYEGIVSKAKNIIKIDHHKVPEGSRAKDYNFGHINLVDTTRKCAGQIVLQFTNALGLAKKLDSEITDPLGYALLGDTGKLKYLKKGTLKDGEILSETSDFEKLINTFEEVTPQDFKIWNRMLSNTEFSEDGKIAYSVFDAAGESRSVNDLKAIRDTAIDKILGLKGVKYCFAITKNSTDPNFPVSASIRSSDKSILEAIEKLGGGGGPKACGLKANGKTPEEMKDLLFTALTEIKNS